MFNDERINLISGKVYRNSIIFGTIISLVYLILKGYIIKICKTGIKTCYCIICIKNVF